MKRMIWRTLMTWTMFWLSRFFDLGKDSCEDRKESRMGTATFILP